MKKTIDSVGEPIGIVTPKCNDLDLTFMELEFDRITNLEEKDIKNHYEMQQTLKRYLGIKLVLFPFHWIMLRFFIGRNDAKHLYSLNKEFYKVIRMDYVPSETILKFSDYSI